MVKRSIAKLKYYYSSAQKKGWVEMLRQARFDYRHKQKAEPYNFSAISDDYLLSDHSTTDEVYANSMGKDGHLNSPSSTYYIFKCFSFINLPARQVTLLDVGCGNGKILVSGMQQQFKKVYGVDLDTKALEIARQNCQIAQRVHATTAYEITNADAATYVIPQDVNVIFLYNPFGQVTLAQVVQNIETSYRQLKRSIYVLYYSPVYASVFEQRPLFELQYANKLKNGDCDFKVFRIKA